MNRALKVVLDWDGTVTEADSLNMVLEKFGDPAVYEEAEAALGRGWTLREVMDFEFRGLCTSLDEVVRWLVEHVRVRPGFKELVRDFDVTVLSSSFVETIEPILRREGVRVELVANRVEARPDGWKIRWRDDMVCAHCSESCKRNSLPRICPIVFVGDGYSDRCAALAADRVFACSGLAEYLEGRRVDYEPFSDFVALRDTLVSR